MTIIRLPVETSNIELSQDEENVFWKQIIPLNKEIFAGGNKIKFDKTLLEQIKSNYDAKILQQVAFQLADDNNSHEANIPVTENYDPQRYRGEMLDLKLNDDGLLGKFKLTEEGAKLIRDNPKLGVSASIKPDYEDRSTGKKHKFVLRHVLGTLAPVIKHMSPWQREEISLSEEDDPNEEVYDLTAPADTQTPDTSQDDKLEVDKAEYEKMQARLANVDKADELLASVIAEVDAEDNLVSLSDTQSGPKEDPRITELQNRAAASEWRAERADYIKSGVPMKLLNLCDNVMSVYEAPTINLSDGEKVDPRDTIRKLLDESKGLIDLSDESGHGMSVDEREAENKATDEYINGFMGKFNMDLF